MQPKQQRALELILAGHSVTDIASQVGVRRETVWRWRNDPSFASEVDLRQPYWITTQVMRPMIPSM